MSDTEEDMPETNGLHLPDLTIKGFRGIEELSIPRLGRVTLLAGRNSVGKTTVLDAIRVYAARGRFSALDRILRGREEVLLGSDEDSDIFFEPDWTSLFYGRNVSASSHISIGPTKDSEQLHIRTAYLTEDEHLFQATLPLLDSDSLTDDTMSALKIIFQGRVHIIPWVISPSTMGATSISRRIRNELVHRGLGRRSGEENLPPQVICQSLGPGLLSNVELAGFWESVALTSYEDRAVQSLGLIFGTQVERVAVIGAEPRTRNRSSGPKAVVKLKGHDRPVPLRSLGDGALRLFGVALAIANSRGGFLLIDEAENGIHYTLQKDFWRMVLQAAQENNVQVIATTHSGDCIKGFAQASMESKSVEGVLFRLSTQDGALSAVEYSEEELLTAAKQGIEVR